MIFAAGPLCDWSPSRKPCLPHVHSYTLPSVVPEEGKKLHLTGLTPAGK